MCPQCGDSRHVRTLLGWRRCVCIQAIQEATFIRPALRVGARTIPELILTRPRLPVDQSTVVWGRAPHPQHLAWHSLTPHVDSGLIYEVLLAYKLVDIYFRRADLVSVDGDERSAWGDLVIPDLLVIVIGAADLPNKLMGQILHYVLTSRQQEEKATWALSALRGNAFRDLYGPETYAAFKALPAVTFGE